MGAMTDDAVAPVAVPGSPAPVPLSRPQLIAPPETSREQAIPEVIGAAGEADEQAVRDAWQEAQEAGPLPVTADPRWTGPDGHVHVITDHDPGSRQHHSLGLPHHH